MNVIEILMRQKAIVKLAVLALILVIIIAVYWQFFYRPVMAEVKTLEPELTTLKQELSAKQAIVAERPKYEAELEQTRHELVLALKQLPDKSDLVPRKIIRPRFHPLQAQARGNQELLCRNPGRYQSPRQLPRCGHLLRPGLQDAAHRQYVGDLHDRPEEGT